MDGQAVCDVPLLLRAVRDYGTPPERKRGRPEGRPFA